MLLRLVYLTTLYQHLDTPLVDLQYTYKWGNVPNTKIFNLFCALCFSLETVFRNSTTTTATMLHHKCVICRFFGDEPLHQFVKPYNAETHDSACSNTIQMCHVFRITKTTHRSVCPLIIMGGSINLKMPRLRDWTFADKTNRNICYSSVWNIHCLIAT
jgi:hypothetical protein